MKILRDYQEACVDAVFQYIAAGGRAPVCSIPVGGGKSLVAAAIFKKALAMGVRCLLLTHVEELVMQDYEEFREYCPEHVAGVYSAGLGRKEHKPDVVFASVQSLARNVSDVGKRQVVIIDEAHLVSRKGSSQYHKVLRELQRAEPEMVVIGLSGTPYRLDSGLLTNEWRGAPAMFERLVFDLPITLLLDRKVLAPLVARAPKTTFDLDKVGTRLGDYKQEELAAACDNDILNKAIAAEIADAMKSRNIGLVFCVSVDHAKHMTALLNEVHGYNFKLVTGEMEKAERKQFVEDMRSGKLSGAVNVGVLTTGFNVPQIDLIASVRPTKSKALHVQMLGRGMRSAPGKTSCMVLDFAQNVPNIGPIDQIDGSKKSPKGFGGPPPQKICPSCSTYNATAALKCYNEDCTHVFPAPDKLRGVSATVESVEPISGAKANWVKVASSGGGWWQKPGKPPVLQVKFVLADQRIISVFLSFDPQSNPFALRSSLKWWSVATGGARAPSDVQEALERLHEARIPARVLVSKDGAYWRVDDYDYTGSVTHYERYADELARQEAYA